MSGQRFSGSSRGGGGGGGFRGGRGGAGGGRGGGRGGGDSAKAEWYPDHFLEEGLLRPDDSGKYVPATSADGLHFVEKVTQGTDKANNNQPFTYCKAKVHYTSHEAGVPARYMPMVLTPILKVARTSWQKWETSPSQSQGADFGEPAENANEAAQGPVVEQESKWYATVAVNVVGARDNDVPSTDSRHINYDMDAATAELSGAVEAADPGYIQEFREEMGDFDKAVVEAFYPVMAANPALWAPPKSGPQTIVDTMTPTIRDIRVTKEGRHVPYQMVVRIALDDKTGDFRGGKGGCAVFRSNPNYREGDAESGDPYVPVVATEGAKLCDAILPGALVRLIVTEPSLWKSGKNYGMFWFARQIIIFQDGKPWTGGSTVQSCLLNPSARAPAPTIPVAGLVDHGVQNNDDHEEDLPAVPVAAGKRPAPTDVPSGAPPAKRRA